MGGGSRLLSLRCPATTYVETDEGDEGERGGEGEGGGGADGER